MRRAGICESYWECELDGVGVAGEGNVAEEAWIGATQIQAIGPSSTAAGTVEAKVAWNGVASDSAWRNLGSSRQRYSLSTGST